MSPTILASMELMIQEVYECARRPSPESWRIICETLDVFPLKTAARVILRLKKLLADWPDELRATMCGMEWDDRFLEGKPDPRSGIVRHLRLDKIFVGRYGQIMIRNVKLTPEALHRLGNTRGSRHLTMLTISGHDVGMTGMRQLARAEHLTNLRHLKANRCHMGRGGFEALMQATFFPQLESLSLTGNDFNEAAFDILAAVSKPVALRSLSLDENPLGRIGAGFLASTPIFSSLTRLSLSDCALGPGGAAELADAMFPALEHLNVSKNELGDAGLAALCARSLTLRHLELHADTISVEGIRALARSGWSLQRLSLRENRLNDDAMRIVAEVKWPDLVELTLDDNDVTPVGLEMLLASTTLESLAELSLGTNLLGPLSFARLGPASRKLRKVTLTHNRLGDDGLSALCQGPWEALRELDIAHNNIKAQGLECLSRTPFFDRLTNLNLAHNPLTDAIGPITWPRKLERLDLSHTGVGDKAIEALAESPCFPEELILCGCKLTDRGAQALAESPILERVHRLVLDDNAIGDAGAVALARALERRDVRVLSLEKNQIGDQAVLPIAQSPSLVVYLDDNPYGETAREALQNMPVRCCP